MISKNKYKQAAYEQAISFRKRGFSYSEIAKICAVSTSTVHSWLAHESFSQAITDSNKKRAAVDNKVRIALVNKARRTERATQYEKVLRLAETEFKNYFNSPLFIAGLMLYYAQGDTNSTGTIRLSTTKPESHTLFLQFACAYLGLERKSVRFWLHLYPTHDEVRCMRHWVKKTGLSAGQFYKNQVIKSRSNKLTLHFGVGNTIIASTLLKKKLNLWIELALKEFEK